MSINYWPYDKNFLDGNARVGLLCGWPIVSRLDLDAFPDCSGVLYFEFCGSDGPLQMWAVTD